MGESYERQNPYTEQPVHRWFSGLLDLDRAVGDALGHPHDGIEAYDASRLKVSKYIYEKILKLYVEYRSEKWFSNIPPSKQQIKDSFDLMAPCVDDSLGWDEVRVLPGFIRKNIAVRFRNSWMPRLDCARP